MGNLGGWGDWIELHRRVWSRIALARTQPSRADEAWPPNLTGSQPVGEGDEIYHHVLALGRTAFGVDLAFERLVGARADFDALFGFGGDAALAEAGFRMSSEMHALFVFADGFWDHLQPLSHIFPGVPELARAVSAHELDADTARKVRDHVEHLAERVTLGRRKQFGQPMTAETFRRVAGGFDGRMAYYGDETFDVPAIRDAVADAADLARVALLGSL